MQDQSGKTVLVTGGNSGVGYETCLAFAEKGATVYLAARSQERAEEAIKQIKTVVPDAKVIFLKLDLQDLHQTLSSTKEFKSKEKKLDILINNAGIMATPFELTKDGIESQFATNHVGHYLLTRELIPLLLKTPEPRVINLSSYAHTNPPKNGIDFENINNPDAHPTFVRYGQSKLANILFTRSLLKRYGDKMIVASVHPGFVRTALMRGMAKNSTFVNWFGDLFQRILAITPVQGALTTLYTATEDIKKDNGSYYAAIASLEEPTALARDEELAEKLWNYTEELVNKKLQQKP